MLKFVVFDHRDDLFRSHRLVIRNTILDFYYNADVLALLGIKYVSYGEYMHQSNRSAERACAPTRQPFLGKIFFLLINL